MAAAPLMRRLPDGIELRVRLTPRSSHDRVEGQTVTAEGPALAARVRAVPSEGEANDAACRLLAEWLGLPKSCVALTAGGKSRIKVLKVSGTPAELEAAVCVRLAQCR